MKNLSVLLIAAAMFLAASLAYSQSRRQIVKREIIRVEPFDSNFEKWGVPVSTCTRAGDMIFISGMPPFDPKTGELLVNAPFEQQAERILEELKTALEAAGSDLEHVMKVNVLCTTNHSFLRLLRGFYYAAFASVAASAWRATSNAVMIVRPLSLS